jgi:hypothetical protein
MNTLIIQKYTCLFRKKCKTTFVETILRMGAVIKEYDGGCEFKDNVFDIL